MKVSVGLKKPNERNETFGLQPKVSVLEFIAFHAEKEVEG
jgi:hypothetical protein